MRSWIAVLLSLFTLGAWAQGVLRLRNCEKGPCPPRQSMALTAIPPRQHWILQFRTRPGAAILGELEGRGIRVLGYVPDSGLMVAAARPAGLQGLEVTWAGPLEAADKISPELARGRVRAYLVVFHADVPMEEARALVEAYGFQIIDNPDLLPGQLVVTGTDIPDLAASDSVAYIMPASTDLVAGLPVMACAGPITEAGLVAEYVQVGSGWPADTGGGVSLGYFFQSLTPKLDESTVRGEIERAFLAWQKYANVQLSPGSQADAARTITILFASGAHGDGYPFDGEGGVLAHTFYPAPPDSEPIAGDMHFDADEDWHAGSYVDLFTVALHEAGHALGLGHTSQPDAVMYPYYHMATGLTRDDIAGIQALYGAAGAQPPTPQPSNPPDPTPPSAPPAQPPATPPSTDTTPPSLTIISPGASIVSTSLAWLEISGTASDNVGVTAVKWSTSNGDAGTAAGTTAWSAAVPLLVGNTVITMRAYDASGNSGWRSLTAVRN